MKVYITKYALTKGILEKDATVIEDFPKMIRIENVRWPEKYFKPDWHETKEQAIKQAEEMRIKKIATLKRAIKKLETKTFTHEKSE